ncbi:hypothetical protein J1N09_05895 [Aureitalea sp. L0-47]|uniref:hypothetical protein n=1 Tax=Aureitalea sp. L0-47 TaxID=2816962 RepID=UPI0022385508|nr:hypothetical protein [Aureitalea sp. L0-47]MCW5519360.1 hypothetical protein [Aureitalea sp. L0-47]
MKRLLLTLVTITLISVSMNAQRISKHALGLRLGDSDGFGTEVNYQLGLGENNRLELGLGWRNSNKVTAVKAVALYQWVWVLDGNFNWYAGAGGGAGQVSFDDDFIGDPDDETFLFAAGDIGIEYNFDIPLLLSLDFRPEFGFGDYRDDVDFDIALGVRYQF